MIPVEIWAGTTDFAEGYGVVVRGMARGLRALGTDVSVQAVRDLPAGANRDLLLPAAMYGDSKRRDVVRLCITIPPNWRWRGARWRVGLTMYETSKLPTGLYMRHRRTGELSETFTWADYCNSAALILVPSLHNIGMFAESGVTANVTHIPLAIDTDAWRFIERPAEKDTYTFLMHGALDLRKGFDVAYHAFWRAFGDEMRHDVNRGKVPKVRLILKTRKMTLYGNYKANGWNDPLRFEDPNVYAFRGDWSLHRLMKLFEMADCYIYPSRGEGFGLTPREAAATGLPAIVPRHTGFDVPDLDEWAIPLEKFTPLPAHFESWGRCGDWLTPDVDELAERMTWCREHRTEALSFGRRASRHVRQYTWIDAARRLVNALCEQFGFSPADLMTEHVRVAA